MDKLVTIKEAEDKLITIALAKTGGNRDEAAKLLGVGRRTLYQKIAERRKKG